MPFTLRRSSGFWKGEPVRASTMARASEGPMPGRLASWGIALIEYLLQVPANRIGYRVLSAYQLKVMQEAITLAVFMGFAAVWLGEGMHARYLVSFALIFAAVVVAFR